MNKNEIAALLVRVDNYLARVPVSGEGVFAMAEARRTLTRAYDAVRQPEEQKEDRQEEGVT